LAKERRRIRAETSKRSAEEEAHRFRCPKPLLDDLGDSPMRQPHCRTRSDDANSNEHQRKLVSSLGDIRGSCGRGHGWDRCRSRRG